MTELAKTFQWAPFRSAVVLRMLRKTGLSNFRPPTKLSCITITALTTLLLLLSIAPSALAYAPSFRDARTQTTGQTTSITIERPTLLAGDVMIAAITILSPNTGLTITPPSGWTFIRQDLQVGEVAQTLFYKVATASEPADYLFTHNQSREAAGAIAAYWGVDTVSPIDVHDGQYVGSPPTAPSLTTTVSNTALVAIFGTKGGRDLGTPTGMTERWRAEGTNGHQGFDEAFAGPGLTGIRSSATNESSTIGQMIALRPANNPTPDSAGTVLFVTLNNGSYTAFEQLRVDHIKSWGYTVLPVYQNAADSVYDIAISQADAAYISANVQSNSSVQYMRNSCIGVLNEEGTLADDIGIASNSSSADETLIRVFNNTHYITQPFGLLADYPLFTVGQRLYTFSGTIAPDAKTLGIRPASGGAPSLLSLDIGGATWDGFTSRGRWVELTWGTSQVDFTEVTATGLQLMKRSLEWAAQDNTCAFLYKRAFSSAGTPIINSATLPTGSEVKFLMYINNKGGFISDINVLDVLDTITFSYVENSLKMDNTLGECAANTCTAAEEYLIFLAVNDNTASSKGTDLDGVRYDDVNTVEAGEGTTNNGQVDINGNSVWALLFSVTIN